jgi:hypothetical protein
MGRDEVVETPVSPGRCFTHKIPLHLWDSMVGWVLNAKWKMESGKWDETKAKGKREGLSHSRCLVLHKVRQFFAVTTSEYDI